MGARVLVIEDNQANMELVCYLLNAAGHELLTATDGEIGLVVAARERPDLVLCDVRLPGRDGYAVARAMKSDAALRAIPLVAVTALAMHGDREKALAAGFDHYLTKPLDPMTFATQIASYLAGTTAD
jgi:CheY-like chemotaxis protein